MSGTEPWANGREPEDAVATTPGRREAAVAAGRLGDFTTSPRLIYITLIAIAIGALSAFVALALLKLIGLFTNLFFFGRWSAALVSPADNRLGPWAVVIPVIGGLLAGNVTGRALLGILIVKSLIWAISLGSGTSGGVLAPLLLGGALGGVEAPSCRTSGRASGR